MSARAAVVLGVLLVSAVAAFAHGSGVGVDGASYAPQEPTDMSTCVDNDRDGFGQGCPGGADCDDSDPDRHPEAVEVCDYVDNNCDFVVDEGCPVETPVADERVVVPKSAFVMGSDAGEGARDERPEHTVVMDRFEIDQYEVTVARYRACVSAGACSPPGDLSSKHRQFYYEEPDFAHYPAVNLDWYQAQAFCRWDGGDLPTEAQWEKAARGPAPSERIYPWGDEDPDCVRANFGGVAGCVGDTDRVGRRTLGGSPYGVLDLAGNVWEWVNDWYDSAYYGRSPERNPPGPDWGSFKVIRGGCFEMGPDNLRVACRANTLPTSRSPNIGFRCARSR